MQARLLLVAFCAAALLLHAGRSSAQMLPVAVPDTLHAAADSIAKLRDVGDLLNSILKRKVSTEVTTEPRKGLSMTLLPNGGYNPATGPFIGASISLGGWLGDPRNTTLSSGSLGLTFSEG